MKKGELIFAIFERESVYYRYLSFYNWLLKNNDNWNIRDYPSIRKIKDEDKNLWYSSALFNHTKIKSTDSLCFKIRKI